MARVTRAGEKKMCLIQTMVIGLNWWSNNEWKYDTAYWQTMNKNEWYNKQRHQIIIKHHYVTHHSSEVIIGVRHKLLRNKPE